MIAMPEARPSMLSSRLIAFVMPISQKIASAMFSKTELGPRQSQTVVNDEGSAEHLPDQFLVWLDVDQIVDEADEKQESAREQNLFAVRDRVMKKQRGDDN